MWVLEIKLWTGTRIVDVPLSYCFSPPPITIFKIYFGFLRQLVLAILELAILTRLA